MTADPATHRPAGAAFALDRSLFAEALSARFGSPISLLEIRRPRYSQTVADYFRMALDANAIRAPSNLQVAVHATAEDDLLISLREDAFAIDGTRLVRHTSTRPFCPRVLLNVVLQDRPVTSTKNAFEVSCEMIETLLEFARPLPASLVALREADAEQRAACEHPLFAVLRSAPDHGEELVLVVAGGRTIRTDAGAIDQPWVGAHYLRVCDPDGTEVAYWTHDEWAEEPVATIAAVFACALRVRELSACA